MMLIPTEARDHEPRSQSPVCSGRHGDRLQGDASRERMYEFSIA
jgi:hypothetical protein